MAEETGVPRENHRPAASHKHTLSQNCCIVYTRAWAWFELTTLVVICQDHRGCARIVVGFTTTYAISAYHHWRCEFEPRSGRGVQHYVIKFVSDLRQVGGFLRFPPLIKLTATIKLKYCWKWCKTPSTNKHNGPSYFLNMWWWCLLCSKSDDDDEC